MYFPGDNKWNTKYTFVYDEKGNLIEEKYYHPVRGFDGGTSYKYDEKGNMVERILLDSNNRQDGQVTYKYNENGDIIQENMHSTGSIRTWSYEYDSMGNWIKKMPSQSVFEEPIEEKEN